jgi:hypothetical protein
LAGGFLVELHDTIMAPRLLATPNATKANEDDLRATAAEWRNVADVLDELASVIARIRALKN